VSAFFLSGDYYVIDVCKIIYADLVFKYGLRHSVEGWASILQAFGHSNVAIPTKGFDEACFVFVFFSWLDLMVATQTI
jgi:hypothetical protein